MGLYTVQSGDTLAKIAESNGTTVENIAKINHIADVNMIFAGSQLDLGDSSAPQPVAQSSVPPAVTTTEDLSDFTNKEDTYTIQSGDTLFGIAQKTGVSIDDLIDYNDITDPNKIYTGNVLLLKPKIEQLEETEVLPVDNNTEVLDDVEVLNTTPEEEMTRPLVLNNVEQLEEIDLTKEPEVLTTTESKIVTHGTYEGKINFKRSASERTRSSCGRLTYDNKKYTVGSATLGDTISQADFLYLVGQVAGESANDNDDMLGVTCTILNRLEVGESDGTIRGILSQSYWPWGKTCDKFINYDASGVPTGLKTIEQIGAAEYNKLQQVLGVVNDALNGVRNLDINTRYYAGDGVHNYFSDSYL